jgi:DDB1- and CUL4-associated factor 7
VFTPFLILAFEGDDCQLLLWDLASHTQIRAASPRNASARLNSPRPDTKKRIVADPVMAYTGHSEITNVAWSPYINSMVLNTGHPTGAGEWLAIAMGRDIQALKV